MQQPTVKKLLPYVIHAQFSTSQMISVSVLYSQYFKNYYLITYSSDTLHDSVLLKLTCRWDELICVQFVFLFTGPHVVVNEWLLPNVQN